MIWPELVFDALCHPFVSLSHSLNLARTVLLYLLALVFYLCLALSSAQITLAQLLLPSLLAFFLIRKPMIRPLATWSFPWQDPWVIFLLSLQFILAMALGIDWLGSDTFQINVFFMEPIPVTALLFLQGLCTLIPVLYSIKEGQFRIFDFLILIFICSFIVGLMQGFIMGISLGLQIPFTWEMQAVICVYATMSGVMLRDCHTVSAILSGFFLKLFPRLCFFGLVLILYMQAHTHFILGTLENFYHRFAFSPTPVLNQILTSPRLVSGAQRLDRLHYLNQLDSLSGITPSSSDLQLLVKGAGSFASTFSSLDLLGSDKYKPLDPVWDVFFDVALLQNLAPEGIEKTMGEFKARLPKQSSGDLPKISQPAHTEFPALALKTTVTSVEPDLLEIQKALKQGVYPLSRLGYYNQMRWISILAVDVEKDLLLVRKEIDSAFLNQMQTLYEAGLIAMYKSEILAHKLAVLPLKHFLEYQQSMLEPLYLLNVRQDSKLNHLIQWYADTDSGSLPVEGSEFEKFLSEEININRLHKRKEPEPYAFLSPAMEDEKRKQELLKRQHILNPSVSLKLIRALNLPQMIDPEVRKLIPDLAARLELRSLSSGDAYSIGLSLLWLKDYKGGLRVLEYAHAVEPLNSEMEVMWQIARMQNGLPPQKLNTYSQQNAGFNLYYLTLRDLATQHKDRAFDRIKRALRKDRHNLMAMHLGARYFNLPLDSDFAFSAPEGL